MKIEQLTNTVDDLISETLKCSPQSWKEGTLTLTFDGNWLDYKLKSSSSQDRALISAELKQLCENFTVETCGDKQQWSEAYINFSRNNGIVDYKISFNYEAAKQNLPPPMHSLVDEILTNKKKSQTNVFGRIANFFFRITKQQTYDLSLFEGIWLGETTEDEYLVDESGTSINKTRIMFRREFSPGNQITIDFKFIYHNGEKRQLKQTGTWQVVKDVAIHRMKDEGYSFTSEYKLLNLKKKLMRYQSIATGKIYVVKPTNKALEEKWNNFLK